VRDTGRAEELPLRARTGQRICVRGDVVMSGLTGETPRPETATGPFGGGAGYGPADLRRLDRRRLRPPGRLRTRPPVLTLKGSQGLRT